MEHALIREQIRSAFPPFDHQIVGIDALVKWDDPHIGRIFGGCFALFDEMGVGKTYQVINAAQILFEANALDRVFVVAPAPIRTVWFHPELGELKNHLWPDLPVWVTEYHSRRRQWKQGKPRPDGRVLKWVVTNYDFIRDPDRRAVLLQLASKRSWIILDESTAIKNPSAIQTKACLEIRKKCGRASILNGTPSPNGPGDLFSQAYFLDPRIFGCKSYYHFKARYGVMGGWQGRQVVAWRDIPDIQRRFAPYILRRLKEQCVDLPEKLPPVIMEATMKPSTWNIYKQMRDDMVAWLSEDTLATAQQAIVRILRLSQITSGFLGGVQQGDVDYCETTEEPEVQSQDLKTNITKEIGSEKLDLFMELFKILLEGDDGLKLLVWCRFRAELNRLHARLSTMYPTIPLGRIHGGQKRDERDAALRLLDPRVCPSGPVVVVGTPASGAMGLNLTASHTVVYLSNDYNLKTRLQSEDRVHRPGQTSPVSYFDIVAEGPNGQKTIDHTIMKALKAKDDLAKWTASAWLSELKEELTIEVT